MPRRHPHWIAPLAVVLLLAAPDRAAAQRHAGSASIGVSLRVLPVASFEGGPSHRLAVTIAPGRALYVEPAAGVRTRMTYNAPTRVVATTADFRGPGGASVRPVLVCAAGAAGAAVASVPFDCRAGLLTAPGSRAAALPLAVGASLAAHATRGLPPGLYVGVVTLEASHRAY
jgi:hypothetical protein